MTTITYTGCHHTIIHCIDCRQPTPYRGVGQYCCPHCHNNFLNRWLNKSLPDRHIEKATTC